jgi:Glycoside hydrolase family 44
MSWKNWTVIASLVAIVASAAVVKFHPRVPHRILKAIRPSPSSRVPVPMETALTLYDDKLGDGWTDWGWGPHENPPDGSVRVFAGGYGGIILHHETLHESYGGVLFRYLAPREWGDFLFVSARYERQPGRLPDVVVEPRHVATLSDGWREAFIPWDELNPENVPIDRIMFAARLATANSWMTLNKIVLTKATAGPAREETTRKVDLAIRCYEPDHPISPLIYGVSMGAFTAGATANRIGGNIASRLNWDLAGTWNTGSDWFFENVKGGGDVWSWISDDVKHSVGTAIVVPTIGWVAKDATSSGFPRTKFPKQRKFDQYRPEAGDGFAPDGTPIIPGSPTETSVEAPPELVARWVRRARAIESDQGVRMYILDNEPALWDQTHRDVHPEPVGYDELLDRTIRYASAIREADPGALIAGPAEWGWTNYFTSAKDRPAHGLLGPDRLVHGGTPLIAWYLDHLAENAKKTGVSLLDVLDVHYYPAAQGIYGSNGRTDAEGAALRIRSTRALWDPDYRDESWIDEPVRLIPRLKDWVAEHYPGRKVSLGEWSFGADDHISGGLATAEALGRFGQQGLDAAFYWGGPKEGSAAFWAFRAFRNFDGKGGHFLDRSLRTTEGPGVSLFASRDASGSHVVAILLNLDPDSDVTAKLNVETCGDPHKVRAFRYAAGSKSLTEDNSKLTLSAIPLAPYSLLVLDLEPDQP